MSLSTLHQKLSGGSACGGPNPTPQELCDKAGPQVAVPLPRTVVLAAPPGLLEAWKCTTSECGIRTPGSSHGAGRPLEVLCCHRRLKP